MSLLLLVLCFAIAGSGCFAVLYTIRLSSLRSPSAPAAQFRADRYRPMLRLLSEDDLSLVRNNKELLRKVRSRRVEIFRGYVRCLSRDYARLLDSIGLSAVQSATDRPDLAWLMLQSRLAFAVTLCRLDVTLFLYRFGVCGVDVSGLVEAMESLSAIAPSSARLCSTPA